MTTPEPNGRTGDGEGASGRTPGLGGALALLLVVAGLFLLGGLPVQIVFGEAGLLVAQLGFLLVPAILFLKWWGYDPVRTLSLKLPSGAQVAGGILVLAGGVQIAWFLAWLQSLVMPVPTEYLEAMSDVLRADSAGRFLWLLLLAGVVPALSEEVLFRGVLLSGFRSALPAVGAVVLAGVVFGIFHLSPQTGFRFLPTAWLGILLGWIVVVSGSLPLAILLHFVNNALILAAVALPGVEERLGSVEEDPSLVLLVVAIVTVVIGLRILHAARTVEDGTGSDHPRLTPAP